MNTPQQNQLLKEHFSQFVSEHKKKFMERVLAQRTRYLTMVLEDIYQSQNTSAVVRTCECLGLQDIHVIESNSTWSTNKLVLRGSDKWLTINRYREKNANNIETCFHDLRQRGYRIAVTDPSSGVPVDEVPLDKPLAVVMGNERHGSSPYALAHADVILNIPMAGFTESMNISVSAAICIQVILSRLKRSEFLWSLNADEKEALRLEWYKKVVRNAGILEREFLRSIE